MATPAQITANRVNAQKSTGPRSREGKSASSFNALKHGLDAQSVIIPGEDPAEYDALVDHYHREFRPESPSATFHVNAMIRADWHKRRLQRVEAQLYRTLFAETGSADLATALLGDSPAAKLLVRIQRQIAAFERSWYRANAELRRARRATESAEDRAFERDLAHVDAGIHHSISQLASFPESRSVGLGPTAASEVRPDRLSNPALRL